MATAAVNLSVPAPADDSMEMSSPARHDYEDIDFDDYEPHDTAVQAADDERMMEDGEQTRPVTATDDVMEDDMQQGDQSEVQEAEMEDSPSHPQPLEDEELIDYSDDELPDEIVPDVEVTEVEEQPSPAAPAVVQHATVDEEATHQPDDAVNEKLFQGDGVDAAANQGDLAGDLAGADETYTADEAADGEEVTLVEGDDYEADHDDPDADVGQAHADAEAGLEEHQVANDAESQRPVISLDTTAQAYAEGPGTPTDTGLHAMTVHFHDHDFPLFKSRNQPDGLLKNDNLASLSLGELIQNCRQRLAVKTGEALSEGYDLVLAFDQLGLILIEDSRAAFECSLEEILDVYLQLYRNDETEDIPPFSLNLSLQLKFTSSVSVLKQAAAGGSGMSTFGLPRGSGEEHGGEYDDYADEQHGDDGYEDDDEQYHQEEAADGQAYEQDGLVEGSNPAEHQADTNDLDEQIEAQQGDYAEQEGHYEGEVDYYQEDPDQGHYQEDPLEATQGHDAQEDTVDTQQPSNGANEEAHDQDEVTYEGDDDTIEGPVEGEKPVSAATSTTFHGDDGQDATGEYITEDLIDWDDDTDLTSDPSDPANSSLLEEFNFDVEGDAEHGSRLADANAHAHEHSGLEKDSSYVAVEFDGQDAIEHGDQSDSAQHASAEDFVGESDKDHPDLENDAVHEASTLAVTHETEHNNIDDSTAQLETIDYEDHPPVEDDDRFQTAHELFDGDDAGERGHEQNAPTNSVDQTPAAATTIQRTTLDDDDFIDFGEDEELVTATTAANPQASATGSRTPLAKRSFEDLAGEDEIDFDSPEPKKARAS